MLACNLPVVALEGVHINADAYFRDPYLHTSCGSVAPKEGFWKAVRARLNEQNDFMKKYLEYPDHVRRHYATNLSLDNCVEKLRECLKDG